MITPMSNKYWTVNKLFCIGRMETEKMCQLEGRYFSNNCGLVHMDSDDNCVLDSKLVT
jgi:hypothetical protein